MVYQFDNKITGKFFKVDPQVAGKELEQIKKSNGGVLSAENVLDVAKNKSNPLHVCFEWDDEKAAKSYRLQLSRRLIRSIVIVENKKGKESSTPAFLSVRITPSLRSYVDVKSIKKDTDLINSVEKSAITELELWVHRYRSFSQLSAISLVIKNAISTHYGYQEALKNGTIKPIKTLEDVADAWQQIIETEKAAI